MKEILKWQETLLCLILTIGTWVDPCIAAEIDDCGKEVLLAYYPGVFVEETLLRFQVPKEEWAAILSELADRDKQIIKQIEEKASQMKSNPLLDPQQRQVAVKLFRETLLDNFGAVLRSHGVTDEKQIQSMLDDIQEQKAKRFARCMEQRKVGQNSKTEELQTVEKK